MKTILPIVLILALAGCGKEPVIVPDLAKPRAELMAPVTALPPLPVNAGPLELAKDAAATSAQCVYDQKRLTHLQAYVRTITKQN